MVEAHALHKEAVVAVDVGEGIALALRKPRHLDLRSCRTFLASRK